ncbi:MAG TPA: CBS domain-containing protein [Polyangiales bacterium]|jgi:acetoin utilization protein AcuB|nr:CBS domain-containing protein [Polyangiales bacterium]
MNHIKDFMTEAPHAIGHDQPLKLAHERMQHFGIRHLPVLDRGVLVGVVSERDVSLISSLSKDQADTVTVEEAMSEEPFAVAPDDDLVDVCTRMAQHKYDCAVIMDHNKVTGVYTTTDALQMLAALLPTSNGNALEQVRAKRKSSMPPKK